jgi:hypothetical protein
MQVERVENCQRKLVGRPRRRPCARQRLVVVCYGWQEWTRAVGGAALRRGLSSTPVIVVSVPEASSLPAKILSVDLGGEALLC